MARNYRLISESSQALEHVYNTLLERFGEPIGKQRNATVGAADEGPGGKALWDDKPKADREWSDPDVVKEDDHAPDCTCNQCGSMKTMEGECSKCAGEKPLDEVTPPGFEKVVKGLKKNKDVKNPWAVAWSMKDKGVKPKR